MRRAIYLIAAAFVGPPVHAEARELGKAYSLDTPSDAEIVVTALKKEQRIQSTPVSLDVFSDLDLKSLGVVTSNELSKASPSLTVTNGGGSNTSLFMRGVQDYQTSQDHRACNAPDKKGACYDLDLLASPSCQMNA